MGGIGLTLEHTASNARVGLRHFYFSTAIEVRSVTEFRGRGNGGKLSKSSLDSRRAPNSLA
jgi:hypothetical protein